ncbi:MAG: hypothetical protein HYZ26_02125 [Chloroflexi bacterium]|nr:hypothetical protein [Chloroflexota bacterium]
MGLFEVLAAALAWFAQRLVALPGWLESILLDLIAAALFSGLILAAPETRRLRLRRFLRLPAGEKFDVVCSAIAPEASSPFYRRPTTGYGELLALANLLELFTYIYRSSEKIDIIRLSAERHYPNYRLSNNIITVGGASHNQVTRFFKNELAGRLVFQTVDEPEEAPDRDYYYLDRRNQQEYRAERDNEGNLTLDYGLITKARNPLNPEHSLLYVGGLHTFGLAGSGVFLQPLTLRKHLKRLDGLRDPEFQILLKVRVRGYDVFVEFLDYVTLEPEGG